jgi:hypothetical protein
MLDNQRIAGGVVEHRKAPRVLEGDEVRFPRVVVEVYRSEVSYLLARHLRAVDPLLELWWEYCGY